MTDDRIISDHVEQAYLRRIEQLLTKCKALREEVLRYQDEIARLRGHIEDIVADTGKDALDAKRYRWIRRDPTKLRYANEAEFDAAIDAAMNKLRSNHEAE